MPARVTKLLVGAYALMLCGVGFAGIVSAPWELRQVFGLDVAAFETHIRATFLNQYRFLKSVELGAGLFCIFQLRAILDGGAIGKIFLALVGAGVFARTLAWIVDGRPSWPFLAFLGLEALVFLVTILYWRTRGNTPS